MKKKILVRLGLILGIIFGSVISFLILPFILRSLLIFLLIPFKANIFLIFFGLGLILLLLSILYQYRVHILEKKSIIFLEAVLDRWKAISAVLVIANWSYYILGFSPSAFWLKEFNFWIILCLILILMFIGIRTFFLKFLMKSPSVFSRTFLLAPIFAMILIIFVSFPYIQVNQVFPHISSPEILNFNSDSDLIPLNTKYSWNILLNDYGSHSINITIEKNIFYNNHSLLDIYYSPSSKNLKPILILLHGGGWFTGSKDDRPMKSLSQFLVNHGFTVFTINYRLFPQVQFLQILNDVRDAIVFAKNRATEYFGDRNRTFLLGRSAGAQLALVAAYGANSTFFKEKSGNYSNSDLQIRGVASMYGVTNLSRWASSLLGISADEDPILYELASPLSYKNKSDIPPTFISAGTFDTLVSVENSRSLHKALNEINATNMYVEIPWANHAFDNLLNSFGGQVAMYYLLIFFSQFT